MIFFDFYFTQSVIVFFLKGRSVQRSTGLGSVLFYFKNFCEIIFFLFIHYVSQNNTLTRKGGKEKETTHTYVYIKGVQQQGEAKFPCGNSHMIAVSVTNPYHCFGVACGRDLIVCDLSFNSLVKCHFEMLKKIFWFRIFFFDLYVLVQLKGSHCNF